MLPKTVNFGGGWRVRIKELSDIDYDAAVGTDSQACFNISDDPVDEPFIGTVFMRKKAPANKKVALLLHELLHALIDAYHAESEG